MKKKLLSVVLALILCFALIPSVFADGSKSVLYDQEGLFDEFDTEIINEKLGDLYGTYSAGVAIVTTSSLDGKTAQEYADDFFDENGIGTGDGNDGILLLISESERVWAISTSGSCISVFTDANLDYMSENFLPFLSDGDWYGACISFIEDSGFLFYSAENPSDSDYDDSDYDDYEPVVRYFNYVWLIGSLLVGLIAAVIVTGIFRRGMKSVSMKPSASDYLRSGSFRPGRREDLFLYSTVTVTARPKDDDNDNFSSTHVSSSGNTHGGSSGSF